MWSRPSWRRIDPVAIRPQPTLHATTTLWHLGTRIEASLRDPSTTVATLLAALHPTPAVCGTPTALALDTIRRLEPVQRGFYAGAVGWMDAHGDGDWYVAIRCARVVAWVWLRWACSSRWWARCSITRS